MGITCSGVFDWHRRLGALDLWAWSQRWLPLQGEDEHVFTAQRYDLTSAFLDQNLIQCMSLIPSQNRIDLHFFIRWHWIRLMCIRALQIHRCKWRIASEGFLSGQFKVFLMCFFSQLCIRSYKVRNTTPLRRIVLPCRHMLLLPSIFHGDTPDLWPHQFWHEAKWDWDPETNCFAWLHPTINSLCSWPINFRAYVWRGSQAMCVESKSHQTPSQMIPASQLDMEFVINRGTQQGSLFETFLVLWARCLILCSIRHDIWQSSSFEPHCTFRATPLTRALLMYFKSLHWYLHRLTVWK